jgi:hypothetical protein
LAIDPVASISTGRTIGAILAVDPVGTVETILARRAVDAVAAVGAGRAICSVAAWLSLRPLLATLAIAAGSTVLAVHSVTAVADFGETLFDAARQGRERLALFGHEGAVLGRAQLLGSVRALAQVGDDAADRVTRSFDQCAEFELRRHERVRPRWSG